MSLETVRRCGGMTQTNRDNAPVASWNAVTEGGSQHNLFSKWIEHHVIRTYWYCHHRADHREKTSVLTTEKKTISRMEVGEVT